MKLNKIIIVGVSLCMLSSAIVYADCWSHQYLSGYAKYCCQSSAATWPGTRCIAVYCDGGTGDVYNEECVPAADAYMQCDNEFYDLTVVQKQYPNHVSALCMGTPTVSYSTNRCQMANVQGDTCNN